MINRKEFLKSCTAALCGSGVCFAMKESAARAAEDQPGDCNAKESSEVRDRADAARLRFSMLIEIIEARLPEDERKRTLRALGAKCADTYRASLIDRYKGDIEGFLAEGRRNWMAEATCDKAEGTIRIVDKGSSCSCPLVKVGVTPPSFCDCTLGWQEEAYSVILGCRVMAELEQSILRGGKRCVYRIKVL
jgi:predicted ArsR family transcriptional regulator